MKKFISPLLAAVMLLSLTACGKGEKENEEEKQNVKKYERKLECHKLDRSLLLSQAAEHYGLECIHSYDQAHTSDILGMLGIAESSGYRLHENENKDKEQKDDSSYQTQGRAINLLLVFTFLVGETEQGCLHTEGKKSQKECRVGIKVRYYSVSSAFSGDDVGIKRDQQIVQKPSDYAAEPVDGSILCQ